MSVLEFKPRNRKPDEEWGSGEAVCIGCRHKWTAVAPIGTRWLECPSCTSMKGIFSKPFGADNGDSHFVCRCGCEAMTAYYHEKLFYFRCMNCGRDHTDTIFG